MIAEKHKPFLLCCIMGTGMAPKGCYNMPCLTVYPADVSKQPHIVDVVEVYV